MRLSASPFHPKNQEKLVQESEPEMKVLDDAIKTLKDKEDFLSNVILVIDALSDEQKAQVLKYLISELPESVINFEVLKKQ